MYNIRTRRNKEKKLETKFDHCFCCLLRQKSNFCCCCFCCYLYVFVI